MKKFLLILLFGILCNTAMAQSPDSLYEEFTAYANADGIRITPFMMKLARMAAKDDKDEDSKQAKEFLKRTKRMAIVDMDHCSDADKERFVARIKSVNIPGFERFLDEEGDKAIVFFKGDGNKVSCIISASLDEIFMLTIIEGNYDLDYAKAFAEEQQKGGDSPLKMIEDDDK